MKNISFLLLFISFFTYNSCSKSTKHERPNIIIIITDDQGYGDLGIHGNHHVKTPVIDKFARESIHFKNFFVSPVCAPTRSSLMTGRYSLRTGIRDTYNGGAIMATSEVTIAEMLSQADYTTGIFGKWHLGDNYPSRPIDQGFDESVTHLGGGMGQVGDFTTYFRRDSSYFDPVLWHNGKKQSYEGYCSDIFAREAIRFIEENHDSPFFCYLSFNAPHTPLQVPEKYYSIYKDIDPTAGFSEHNASLPVMSERDMEDARKVYAMVTNIDDNVGLLLDKLDQLGISDNTVVIFMTDNGPQQRRYIAGMRGKKSDVYRGGVRVPFYLRYPELTGESKTIDINAAHIDILPTVAELCGATIPADRKIDGHSLVPLIQGDDVEWKDRSLFFYWTRKYPELYQNIALQIGEYRFIGNTDYDSEIKSFELYNISSDPAEAENLVEKETEKASAMKSGLDMIYNELINSENIIHPPRIIIGNEKENPATLSRNDAWGERGIWAQDDAYAYWKVSVKEGLYNTSFKFLKPVEQNGTMFLETGPVIHRQKNMNEAYDVIKMEKVYMKEGDYYLIPYYIKGAKRILPFLVEIEKISDSTAEK